MSSPRGFEQQEEVIVHEWAMFRLLKRVVRAASGEIFQRTFVSTPGAVATVAVTAEGDIVLVRQYRATFNDLVLEIPAGMRDVEGEDPRETAVRELKEETGFTAGSIEYLGRLLSSPGVTDSVVEVYLATDLQSGQPQPHGPEEDTMTVELVSFAQALEMIDEGLLADSKSTFGILLAARRYPHLVR